MPKGLDDITAQLKKHSGIAWDLGLNLTTQRNLWGAIGETIKYKVLGPMGSLSGTFLGLQEGLKTIIRDSGTLEVAWKRVAAIKLYQGQFEGLLKGAAQARSRLAELAQFGNRRVLNFEEVARTSRGLEILTRGARGGAESLNEVVDAARASGASLEDTGEAIGSFYRALQDGKPVEAAAGALENMGLLSRTNVQALRQLQQTGAPLVAQYQAFQSALAGNSKQSEKFEDTLEGLAQKQQAVREKLSARFGQPFLEGERQGLAASIRLAENLHGPVGAVADNFARVVNFGNGFTKQIAAAATSIPGLTFAAGAASKAFIGLFGVASGAAVIQATTRIGSLVRGGIQAARNFDSVATAAKLLTKAEAAREAASGASGAAALFHAGRASLYEGAAAGIARAPSTAEGILGAVGRGIGTVGRVSGITATIAATAEAAEYAHRLEVQLQALKDANAANDANMQRSINSIRSVDDAQAALTQSTQKLAEAQTQLGEIRQRNAGVFGDSRQIAVQQREVRVSQAQRAEVTRQLLSGRLAPSQAEREALGRTYGRNIALDQLQREAQIDRSTGYQKAELLETAAQRAAAESREASLYDSESGRLSALEKAAATDSQSRVLFRDAQGKPLYGSLSALLAERRRQSPSELVRGEQGLADLRANKNTPPRALAEAEEQFKARKTYLLNQTPDHAIELRALAERARLEAGLQGAEVAAEEKINALREQGRQREEGAAEARLEALREQKALLEQFGDAQGARSSQAKIDGLEREKALMQQMADLQRNSDAARLIVAGSERRAAQAAARGDFSEAGRLHRQALQVSDAAEERQRVAELTASNQYSADEARTQAAQERKAKQLERQAQADIFRTQRGREIREGRLGLSGTAGDAQKLAEMRDQDAFREHIQEGIAAHLSPREATQYAYAQTAQQIAQSGLDQDRSHIVDNLQRIGGGGGVSSDPGLDIARRQVDLLQQATRYLAQMAGGGDSRFANEANVDDGDY